ncbi:MAG: hypothetical protein AAGA43_02170 [Bacteroidota bacterium]
MKTKIRIFISMLIVIALGIGCSAEDGMDGAQGPAGMDGQNGIDGVDGNANVFASEWLEVPESFTNISAVLNETTFLASEITQTVMDSGIILVYGRVNDEIILPIPFQFEDESYYFALNPGELILGGESISNSLQFFALFQDLRYVIVPSNSTTTGKNSSQSILEDFKEGGIDTSDYYAVMDYYGLSY